MLCTLSETFYRSFYRLFMRRKTSRRPAPAYMFSQDTCHTGTQSRCHLWYCLICTLTLEHQRKLGHSLYLGHLLVPSKLLPLHTRKGWPQIIHRGRIHLSMTCHYRSPGTNQPEKQEPQNKPRPWKTRTLTMAMLLWVIRSGRGCFHSQICLLLHLKGNET